MSFTRLRYHVVTATKQRKPLISEEVERIIEETMVRTADACGAKIIAIGGVEDHIHIILACPPTQALSRLVGALKSKSSLAVNNRMLGDTTFEWQKGFSAFTLRGYDYQHALAYVINQKAHHSTDTTLDLYEPSLD